jgi:hypothetical protein
MNPWIRRSIELANAPGYLDELSHIYPVRTGPPRPLPPEIQEGLGAAFQNRDRVLLLRTLLKLGRFPVKDPYGAFLKKDPGFAHSTPKTVRRIADRVFALRFREAVHRLQEPVEFNQQIGPLFSQWLRRTFRFLPALRFAGHNRLAFLSGTNREIMEYANITLRCGLDRGIDFVAKCGNRFFIGEAKFITDTGGQQTERLRGIIQRFLKPASPDYS